MLRPRGLLLFYFLFHSFAVVHAQRVEREFLLHLSDTSAEKLQNAELTFREDNYCYYNKNAVGVVMTKARNYGPFVASKNERGGVGVFYNVDREGQYISTFGSADIYGPYDGVINISEDNFKSGDVAYTVSEGERISYYINGSLVNIASKSVFMDRWCSFSDNGNQLYTIKKGASSYLFLNKKLIDSSRYNYGVLVVDDYGNYSYAIGNYEAKRNNWLELNPLPHSPQNFFVPLKQSDYLVWSYSDSFRYYGNEAGIIYPVDKQGKEYFQMYSFESRISGTHLLYYYRWGGKERDHKAGAGPFHINVDGVGKQLPYSEIYAPWIDTQGHYALFGRRGYFVYKNTDGVEAMMPLSKHGVRATPISIDSKGNTICYYPTEDSVYIYENDRLFASCHVNNFELLGSAPSAIWHKLSNDPLPVTMFSVNDASYVVYDNAISPALYKINSKYHYGFSAFQNGQVIEAKFNQFGYWLLQKTGNSKYDLIINNRRIVLPAGINFEGSLCNKLAYQFRLTSDRFICYVKEGKSIYRYKIGL